MSELINGMIERSPTLCEINYTNQSDSGCSSFLDDDDYYTPFRYRGLRLSSSSREYSAVASDLQQRLHDDVLLSPSFYDHVTLGARTPSFYQQVSSEHVTRHSRSTHAVIPADEWRALKARKLSNKLKRLSC